MKYLGIDMVVRSMKMENWYIVVVGQTGSNGCIVGRPTLLLVAPPWPSLPPAFHMGGTNLCLSL